MGRKQEVIEEENRDDTSRLSDLVRQEMQNAPVIEEKTLNPPQPTRSRAKSTSNRTSTNPLPEFATSSLREEDLLGINTPTSQTRSRSKSSSKTPLSNNSVPPPTIQTTDDVVIQTPVPVGNSNRNLLPVNNKRKQRAKSAHLRGSGNGKNDNNLLPLIELDD